MLDDLIGMLGELPPSTASNTTPSMRARRQLQIRIDLI
jgi:hypothetical protein